MDMATRDGRQILFKVTCLVLFIILMIGIAFAVALYVHRADSTTINTATKPPAVGQTADILYGKKWYACGDSFTAQGYLDNDPQPHTFPDGPYMGEQMVYPFFIGRRVGMDVINLAQGGMSMANTGNGNTFMYVYQNIGEDADYITIKLGINDDNYNADIGTIDSFDTTTFYGAYNTALTWIITNRPKAKIGIIVTNGADQEIAEATKAIALKYGIPTLNMWDDPNVPLVIRSGREDVAEAIRTIRDSTWAVDYDGSRTGSVNRHPNNEAQEYESVFVEAWLRTL